MNRTIFLTTAAALATALIQPLQAKPHEDKGKGNQPAPAEQAAPSKAKAAPKQFSQHKQGPAMSHTAPQQFAQRSQPAPKQFRQQVQEPKVAQRDVPKSFRSSNHKQATVAMGGSQRNDEQNVVIQNRNTERNVNIQNRTQFNRNVNRYEVRNYRPPNDVYRNWDHGRVHVWNNHHYRWSNNDWIIIDSGYDTPYYGYDYSMPPPVVYGNSGNTAMAVQEELSRRGYDPGVIDGVIGPQSRNAIAAYQQDHGLAVTGRIDRPLLREMGL